MIILFKIVIDIIEEAFFKNFSFFLIRVGRRKDIVFKF